MDYPSILHSVLSGDTYSFRTGRRRFLHNYLDEDIEDITFNIDLTKQSLEVPVDLAQNLLDDESDIKTYIYPLCFEHTTFSTYTVGTTALWNCIAESRSLQHNARFTRCFKLLMDQEGNGLYAAPGMVFDNDKNCLFRIVTRLEKQSNDRHKPIAIVMHVSPLVFTSETIVTKAIIKTLIPEFLKQTITIEYADPVEGWKTIPVPMMIEVKPINLTDLETVSGPTPSTFSNTKLCECLNNSSRLLYGCERLLC